MEEFGVVMEELKEDTSPKGKLGNILKLVDIVADVSQGGDVGGYISRSDVKELIRFTFVVAYSELGSSMIEQHLLEAIDLKDKANLYASTIAVGPLTSMSGLNPNEIGDIMNAGDNDE